MVDPKAVSKLKDHMEESRKFGVKRIGLFDSSAGWGKRYLSVVEFEKLGKKQCRNIDDSIRTRSDMREQSAMNLG